MSDAALKRAQADVERLENEVKVYSTADPVPVRGEKIAKFIMNTTEPLTPDPTLEPKEENPWTEGDGGGCSIM